VAATEMKKLRRMSEQQPGFSALREYLQWMADLPWCTTSVPPPPPSDDVVVATADALVRSCIMCSCSLPTPLMADREHYERRWRRPRS
jgi:hypothetical protein